MSKIIRVGSCRACPYKNKLGHEFFCDHPDMNGKKFNQKKIKIQHMQAVLPNCPLEDYPVVDAINFKSKAVGAVLNEYLACPECTKRADGGVTIKHLPPVCTPEVPK